MDYVFPILIGLAMLAVLGSLLLGVINMARGGSPQRSNQLMRSRIVLQAVAILLFAIYMLVFRR
ncbi:MAG TPA: twin transmembrane helix small protein [Stellaceae bacterium]|nr:twin transmembrane helix small protein [Stellaceae bacterium]